MVCCSTLLEPNLSLTIIKLDLSCVLDSETQTPTPAFPDAKPKPRGPIKYPIDDLDVVITDREKKSGKQVTRPQIDRDVPFGKDFEPFLMSWAFFQSFGSVLFIVNPEFHEIELTNIFSSTHTLACSCTKPYALTKHQIHYTNPAPSSKSPPSLSTTTRMRSGTTNAIHPAPCSPKHMRACLLLRESEPGRSI